MLRSIVYIAIVLVLLTILPIFAQVNGEVILREIDPSGQGYSVVRLWGSHYEMGYAFGYLYAGEIAGAIDEGRALVEDWGLTWGMVLALIASYTYKPDCILDEFEGLADGVNDSLPGAGVNAADIEAMNLFGDIYYYGYACRSVSSWGTTTSNSEYSTISTRRLDYFDLGLSFQYHHVVAIFEPNDGSPKWINFAWPGYVSCITCLNEFGTIASLHDWGSGGATLSGSLPRTLASRYALTMVTDPDLSTQLNTVFAELNAYNCATPGFLNYYVPDGHGGVIKHNRTLGYYDVRRPHPECFSGQVIYTNNSDISGQYIGDPWTTYYADYASGGDITLNGQWNTSGPSFHRVTVGYRGRNDIHFKFDGVKRFGYTATVEYEWSDVVGIKEPVTKTLPMEYALTCYPNPFNSSIAITVEFSGNNFAEFQGSNKIQIRIHNVQGQLVNSIECQHKDDRSFQCTWSPLPSLPSGVYFINAILDEFSLNKRVVYMK
ncbi:T9SS type A sorting domain-containing protein [bacterium]|nr:T9SS type A sorting domain-containing protein [bacterium]